MFGNLKLHSEAKATSSSVLEVFALRPIRPRIPCLPWQPDDAPATCLLHWWEPPGAGGLNWMILRTCGIRLVSQKRTTWSSRCVAQVWLSSGCAASHSQISLKKWSNLKVKKARNLYETLGVKPSAAAKDRFLQVLSKTHWLSAH